MKKQDVQNIPQVEKEGWEADELAEEASNADADDIVEQLYQDDEKKREVEAESGGCCTG